MAEQVAAAEVYTGRGGASRGDNSGGAAIFDVPNIKADPNPYAPLAGQYLANEGRKAVKELELKQKRDKELADLSKLKIDNFWIQYQDEIQKDLDAKSQKLAEIQLAGGDNARQDLQREQSKYQLELDGLAKTTEAARQKFEAFVKGKELLSKPESFGVYDEEFYAQKMNELDSLINDGVDAQGNPIPKKSPKEVLDWLNDQNNYPIQAYADFDEIVESRTPEMKKDGRRSYMVKEDVENSVLQWAAGNQEAVESLKKKYKLDDVVKVVPMIVDEIMRKNPDKRDPNPSGGSSGFGNTSSGLTVVPSYDASLGGEQGKSNVVTYVPDNQNMKTIPLIDGSGTPYMTNSFVVKKEGDAYYVYADVVPTEDLEAEAEAGGMSLEQAMAQAISGKSASSSKKKKMKFPVDNRVGETGNSNYETISGLMGKPLEDFIGIDVTKGKSSAKPKNEKGSSNKDPLNLGL